MVKLNVDCIPALKALFTSLEDMVSRGVITMSEIDSVYIQHHDIAIIIILTQYTVKNHVMIPPSF